MCAYYFTLILTNVAPFRRGKKIKSKEEDRGVSLEEPDPVSW